MRITDYVDGFSAVDHFVSTRQSSHKYSILNFSDVHFPLKQAAAAELYEMLIHVYDEGGVQVIVRNGDWFDGWEADGREFSNIQKAVIDVMNRMKAEQGTTIIDTEGNHNDKQMNADVARESEDTGLVVVPGVVINTLNESAVIVHGHQFDSPLVQQDILEEADNEYRRLSKDGSQRHAATASDTKKKTKVLLSALGYDKSYAYAGHKYDVNRVIIGHRHLPEDKVISPYGPLRTALRSLKQKFMNAVKSGSKAESFMTLSEIGARFVDMSGQVAKNTTGKLTLQFLIAHGKTIVGVLSQEHVNRLARRASGVLEKHGYEQLSEVMDIIDSNPNTDILDRVDIKSLRPSHYFDRTQEQKRNPRDIKLTDAGSWIDGNTTFCAYDPKGEFSLIDWREEREKIGLGDMPSEEALVERHSRRFGDFLSATEKEIEHYKTDVSGYLEREKRAEHYALPKRDSMAVLELDQNGFVHVLLPGNASQVVPDVKKHKVLTTKTPASPFPLLPVDGVDTIRPALQGA